LKHWRQQASSAGRWQSPETVHGPSAVIVAYVGTRPEVSKAAVWTIIALNALWAVESIGLLISTWVAPTMLGYAFVIFQAVVVLAFAEAQYLGLRQERTAVAQSQ
jgi:hypothetical protein